jgi:hypothetical protein
MLEFGLQSMFFRYTRGTNAWTQGRELTAVKERRAVCCRRDSAALQAVVWSEEDFLLTVSEDPLFWKGGPLTVVRAELTMEPRIRAEMKLIELMEDDDRRWKSDLLTDRPALYVERRQVQQIWIEAFADERTPPGDYGGTVRFYARKLFEDERPAGELRFTVTVREEVLPEPRGYSFYLDLWQHNANLARKYQCGLWSEDHFRIMGRYYKSMAELGQKAVALIVSEIPWSGQNSHIDREPSDLFEYNMVRVTKRRDGTFEYDYSALDRCVELAASVGIDRELKLFGLLNIWTAEDAGYVGPIEDYPDSIRIRYRDEESGTYRFIRRRDELERYIRALAAHLADKGWIDRVRVVADEPADLDLFRRRLAALKAIAPSLTFEVAINHAEFITEGIPELTDYVAFLPCALAEYERLRELRPRIRGKLLYYVCCMPDRPNTFLASPPLESRLLPWLAERLRFDGFLRWNYTAWTDRPLERISYRYPIWKAGDMHFVYPGPRGEPLLSLRYKWLQRGIRDFEYMQLLKRSGRGEAVQQALARVFAFEHPAELEVNGGSPPRYSLNESDYDALYETH